jgi:hypothetical protein
MILLKLVEEVWKRVPFGLTKLEIECGNPHRIYISWRSNEKVYGYGHNIDITELESYNGDVADFARIIATRIKEGFLRSNPDCKWEPGVHDY